MEKMKFSMTMESTTSGSSNSTSPSPSPKPKLSDSKPRVIKPSEYKAAAACLAEAFAIDDVAQYFIETGDRPNWTAQQKWNLHLRIMEYVVSAHCLKGLALTVGPNYEGVALWMPPGSNMDDFCTIVRSGMWRLNYKLSKEGKKRFFDEFLPLLHNTKHEVMGDRDDRSWYLVYIGTKKEARGKGYARKLVEYVTDIADAEGRACYLESSNDVNPIIYGRLGFHMVKTIHLARGQQAVALDIMIREPKPPLKA